MTLMLLAVGLSGCTEQLLGEITVKAPLNTLGLKLNDLDGNFEMSGENYRSTPYTIEGGIFDGKYVLEYYNSTFSESMTSELMQFLIKLESKEECKSSLNQIKLEISGDFPAISLPTVGDDSYLGGKTMTGLGTEISAYILIFRVANVMVVLVGLVPLQLTLRSYANIILSNINEILIT